MLKQNHICSNKSTYINKKNKRARSDLEFSKPDPQLANLQKLSKPDPWVF